MFKQFPSQFWEEMHEMKNSNIIINKDRGRFSNDGEEKGIVGQHYYNINDVDRAALLKVDNYVIYQFDNGKQYYELITFKILNRIIDENNNLILIALKEVI